MFEEFMEAINHLIDINESLSLTEKDFAKIVFDQLDEDVITPRLEYCPYESASELRTSAELNPVIGTINLGNIQDLMAPALVIAHPNITYDDLGSSFTETCVDIYVEALAMTIFDENGKKINENTKPEKTFEGLQEVFGILIDQSTNLGDDEKDFAKKVLLEIDPLGALGMVTYCPHKSAEAVIESGHSDKNYLTNLDTIESLSRLVIEKNPDHPFAKLRRSKGDVVPNEMFLTECADILIEGIAKYAFEE